MLEMTSPALPPRVVDYTDYRIFLRDFYSFKKSQNRHFSFRKFAALAEIKSSNYLLLVMNRQRNLLPETAKAVARAMRLSKTETDYFLTLVQMEKADSIEERHRLSQLKTIALRRLLERDLTPSKAKYLSVWYYPVVRELAFLTDFKANAKWISRRLAGLITPEQAERAIKVLTELKLWTEKNGRIQVADLFLDTGHEENTFGEINVAKVHQETLIAWSKVLETIPKSQRELGLINIPINAAKVPEFKKRIQAFQDEIIGWLAEETEANELVQLGTYLIPLTRELS
jgi:uncharacterized protein (TIGR02147 family)